MVFPVIGGDGKPTGYEIDNSLRFNDDDDPSLSRTPSSASNRKTWTWSGWVKRSNISLNIMLLSAGSAGQGVYLTSGNQFQLTKDGVGNYGSTALLRDVSAWYHLVVACDTTQTGMANIAKFYINGTEQSTSGTTIYSTNEDTNINDDVVHYISRWSGSSAENHHDGYLADVNFVDGLRLDASYFGETNDNGVWIPKKYTGSYGTNGFFLEFQGTGTSQNSSGIGADTSGNDNHYAVTNLAATDVTTDTPTNNFATWNSLQERPGEGLATFAEGNTKVSGTSKHGYATIALPTSGKWYAEVKFTSGSSTAHLGLRDIDDYTADGNTDRLLFRNDANYDDGDHTNLTSYGSSWTNSIIGIAVNLDDNEVVFYKDGTAQNSGTAISHNASNQFIHAATAGSYTAEANFGNAPFTISSGNSDANGYGNFEYAVPSGYYSLCTKNLAEYG